MGKVSPESVSRAGRHILNAVYAISINLAFVLGILLFKIEEKSEEFLMFISGTVFIIMLVSLYQLYRAGYNLHNSYLEDEENLNQ